MGGSGMDTYSSGTRRAYNSGYSGTGTDGEDLRPIKAVVFSQFTKILNWVGDKLVREFGNDASNFHTRTRFNVNARFSYFCR